MTKPPDINEDAKTRKSTAPRQPDADDAPEPRSGDDASPPKVARSGAPRAAEEVTRKVPDPSSSADDVDVTRKVPDPASSGDEVTRKVPDPTSSGDDVEPPKRPRTDDEVTKPAHPVEVRRRVRGDEVTRRSPERLHRDLPLESTRPDGPSITESLLTDPDEAEDEADDELSGLDADKTSKIDGLPPFALQKKLEQLPEDPDETNKFVRALDAELSGAILAGGSGPARARGSKEREPRDRTQPRPARAGGPREARGRPRLEDAPEPPQGVSVATFVVVSLSMLILGAVLGGIVVFYHLGGRWGIGRDGLFISTPNAPRGQDRAPAPTPAPQADGSSAAPTPGGAVTEPTAPEARRDGGSGSLGDEASRGEAPREVEEPAPAGADSQAPPAGATKGGPGSTVLLPMVFQARRDKLISFDARTLQRLGKRIADDPSLSAEIVAYVHPAENVRPVLAPILAMKRAEEALEHLRAQGASKRRFSLRAAAAGEPLPEGMIAEAGFRTVLLKLGRR